MLSYSNITDVWKQQEVVSNDWKGPKVQEPKVDESLPVEIKSSPELSSDENVTVSLKNRSVCEYLKEYSSEYQQYIVEELIKKEIDESESDEMKYGIYIKILIVVLAIELLKILLYPLMFPKMKV